MGKQPSHTHVSQDLSTPKCEPKHRAKHSVASSRPSAAYDLLDTPHASADASTETSVAPEYGQSSFDMHAEIRSGLAALANASFDEPQKHVAQTGAVLADENMYMPARTRASINNTMDLGTTGFISAEVRRRRLRRWIISLSIACLVAVISSFGILTNGFGLLLQGSMPNVVGYTQNNAEELLTHDGYNVEVQEQQTNEPEQDGMVLASTPASGEATTKGQTIVLKVAKVTSETQQVPDLSGMTEEEALAAIAATNFFIKDDVTYAYSATVAKGTVISQGPSAGSTRTKGTKIDLVVSAGPNPKGDSASSASGAAEVTVPDVIGMTYKEAQTLLLGMGLSVTRGTDVETDTFTNGTVAAISPDTDTDVEAGTNVVLHVAVPTGGETTN